MFAVYWAIEECEAPAAFVKAFFLLNEDMAAFVRDKYFDCFLELLTLIRQLVIEDKWLGPDDNNEEQTEEQTEDKAENVESLKRNFEDFVELVQNKFEDCERKAKKFKKEAIEYYDNSKKLIGDLNEEISYKD